MAIEMGYKVLSIDKIWHAEGSEVVLFASCISRFLKIKTKAPGWPSGTETEEQKNDWSAAFSSRSKAIFDE